MTGATVIPFIPERHVNGSGYTLRFQPPLVLDGDDPVHATQQVNDRLEGQVRLQPEQYLWAHKRFKPPGPAYPDPYA
jgi:KDO2-lipid IV(A) lauroyltransferase